MSYQAVNWALAQDVRHSAAKFLLVVMAHHADKNTWESFLAVKRLAQCTGQDRKTVIVNIARLVSEGFLIDTKRKVGETGQIPVYLLNSTKSGTVSGGEDGGDEDESVQRNSTEIGTAYEAKGTEIGTVQEAGNSTVFPDNSTVFPSKESQISLERVPNLVPVIENLIEKQKKEKKNKEIELPDWLPIDAWNGFLEMRRTIKKPMTDRGKELAIEKLKKLLDAGQNIEAVLNESTMNNWQGLFEIKAKPNQKVDRHGGFGKQDYHAGVADDGSF